MASAASDDALERAVSRVRELAAAYEPPGFEHVPDPDAAIFLCAADHSTGYRAAHRIDGDGPFAGSALMWEVGLRAHARDGGLLCAGRLASARGEEVAELFRINGETVGDPERRAALWRDLAAGLRREYEGSAAVLLGACGGCLGGEGGLVERLATFDAYSDPLAKKAFLFAKICARRGWLEVRDPERWEVCADNVLMRLALRSGLVAEGPLHEVRPHTRAALRELARAAGLEPPVLDDLLWELGREDPDLLGVRAGDLREPPRDPESAWY